MSDEELVLQETAEAAERSGDLEAALDVWRVLSSIDANRPDYFCMSGRVAQKLGRWADAERAFLDAISVASKLKTIPGTPKSPELVDKTLSLAMGMLGSLFLARADGDRSANAQKAKVWLEQAVAVAPSLISLNFLATAHHRLGEREAAKEAFRRAIELNESYAEARSILGLPLADDGQNVEGERLHRIAIAESYSNLGLLLADDGQNVEAERLLRRAAQINPNSHIAHGRLGILLQEQGRYSEAEAELKRSVEIDPTDAIASFYLSRAAGGSGPSN